MTLKNLDTKGYTIIPNFLSVDEINFFKNVYLNEQIKNNTNKNYQMTRIPYLALLTISSKIYKILERLKNDTCVDVDTLIPTGNVFTNTQFNDFYWHQDHESFYIFQQHLNYLNFYIPIVKPDPTKSGLSIIPNDCIVGYNNRIVNGGATKYVCNAEYTSVVDENADTNYIIPVNIEKYAVSPALYEGDLLLLRGDVIHKTQDTVTNRISMSIRCTRGAAPINKTILAQGGNAKKRYIKNNPRPYKILSELFEKYGDTITAQQVCDELIKIYKKM